MSAPSESTLKGKFDQFVGNVKEGVGEMTGNESLANKGAAQQVKGHTEQAWGAVKEGANDLAAQERDKPHKEAAETRDSIVASAERAANAVKEGVHNMTHKDDENR